MLKKMFVIALAIGLVAALIGPAGAKKKPKGPKPYKSEEVTVHLGHPVFNGQSGSVVSITAQEFLASCSIPSSNGLDAWVFEVPADYQNIAASVIGTGKVDNPGGYDLDMYFFSKDCTPTGVANAAGTDEAGAMNAGTAFILLHNYTGLEMTASFTLSPISV